MKPEYSSAWQFILAPCCMNCSCCVLYRSTLCVKVAVSVQFACLHVYVVCVLSLFLLAKQVIPPARCWIYPSVGRQSSCTWDASLGSRESQRIHKKACKIITHLSTIWRCEISHMWFENVHLGAFFLPSFLFFWGGGGVKLKLSCQTVKETFTK